MIRIVSHDGSTFDYHFIIKELAKEFKVNFNVYEKTQKNILLFHHILKKNLIMVKQLHTN